MLALERFAEAKAKSTNARQFIIRIILFIADFIEFGHLNLWTCSALHQKGLFDPNWVQAPDFKRKA
jgi:hypothetical protein